MKNNIPNKNVLTAFGVSGDPIRLIGGQGTCYKVDNLVLKPTDNETEASWVAETYNNLDSDKFRIAKPVRANNIPNQDSLRKFLKEEYGPLKKIIFLTYHCIVFKYDCIKYTYRNI